LDGASRRIPLRLQNAADVGRLGPRPAGDGPASEAVLVAAPLEGNARLTSQKRVEIASSALRICAARALEPPVVDLPDYASMLKRHVATRLFQLAPLVRIRGRHIVESSRRFLAPPSNEGLRW